MEVVLEAVELGTTDPFQNFHEMVLLHEFLCLFWKQKLVRIGDWHAVLAAYVSEAGIDDYLCVSNVNEHRSWPALHSQNAYLHTQGIFKSKGYIIS